MFRIYQPGRGGCEEIVAEFDNIDDAMRALGYWKYNVNRHAYLKQEGN